ncbi:MAG: Spy/CpxP family protein refolding chaperone [Lentimicrobium sp.]
MTQNNRNRILLLIVGVLTIVNLTAITTVIVHIRKFHSNDLFRTDPMAIRNDSLINDRGPAFLFKELGFNDKQQKAFMASRDRFRNDAQPLFLEIRKLNAEMMEEIVKDTPDTLKLNAISNKIGNLHSKVKQHTTRHLLEVKSVATPDQKEKLGFFYRELISRDSGPMGKGMQHRHHRGQRQSDPN